MGLGYALSENFYFHQWAARFPLLRDCGILRAKDTPRIDVILIEVPDEVGGLWSKGAGEIGLVPTAGAVAGAALFLRQDSPLRPADAGFTCGGAVCP